MFLKDILFSTLSASSFICSCVLLTIQATSFLPLASCYYIVLIETKHYE